MSFHPDCHWYDQPETPARYHGTDLHRIDRAALADVLTRNADPIDTLFDTLPRDLVPLLERLAADGGCYVPSFRSQADRARADLATMHAELASMLDGGDDHDVAI